MRGEVRGLFRSKPPGAGETGSWRSGNPKPLCLFPAGGCSPVAPAVAHEVRDTPVGIPLLLGPRTGPPLPRRPEDASRPARVRQVIRRPRRMVNPCRLQAKRICPARLVMQEPLEYLTHRADFLAPEVGRQAQQMARRRMPLDAGVERLAAITRADDQRAPEQLPPGCLDAGDSTAAKVRARPARHPRGLHPRPAVRVRHLPGSLPVLLRPHPRVGRVPAACRG